ncbi:S-layer homology domain-containing protein [Fodinisporobacter ferrooxydans]|uniref:S-layer homology domain-containing protein n=1 Tax=Fodinisporobacter ferrooxydans TaxID=2901836 RepID=A0ABY4CLX9_9BACL|nr:S-layer homology domain-containing protein [Alicyclobacillaceae bacterium MYW30-H2]
MKVKLLVSSAIIALLLIPATTTYACSQGKTIADLSTADSWAINAITDVAKIGWMSGDTSGNFRPHDNINRREIATIITKIMKLDTPNVQFLSYTDVTPSDWGLKYIEAVRKAGIMSGSGDHFRPNDLITNEEFAVILTKLAHLQITNTSTLSFIDQNIPFADKDSIQAWAKPYVEAVADKGLMTGDGTRFNPQHQMTREEVAIILDKLAKYNGNVELYCGTWSTTIANQSFYLVIDDQGNSKTLSLYNGDPSSNKPYFTLPVTFVSGSSTFDTNDYTGSIQLNGDTINLTLTIKSSNPITIFGGKHFTGTFSQKK